MKIEKTTQTTVGIYAAPETMTIEVHVEGIICASAQNEDYNYREFEW